jgi:phospholipid transport system substrate-binding protein
MKKVLLLTSILLLSVLGVARAEVSPEQLVHQTADDILADIKANRDVYAHNYDKLYDMADKKVLPHFDFRRMSQWVLGRYWRQATPEQRDQFVQQFRDLLVRTYSTALLNYKDEKIIYLPVQSPPGADDVLVRTEIKQSGGQPNIPIYYSFYKNRQDEWKVYDVTIDGISLVTQYRATYADKIRSQGLDALIADMADKNKQARASGAAKK